MNTEEIKNPQFIRKWRKYYRIEDVDHHLFRVANQIKDEQAQLAVFRAENETMGRKNSELEEAITQKDEILSEQIREISELGEQLAQARVENARQSEQILQQTVEMTRLQTRIAKLGELVGVYEQQNAEDVIMEAVRKAEKIVMKAVEDRDEMFAQIDEKRGRLVAACRAAYYNALQFKQNLADHFKHMEQELDASIDVLQDFDNSRLVLNHSAVQTQRNKGNTLDLP